MQDGIRDPAADAVTIALLLSRRGTPGPKRRMKIDNGPGHSQKPFRDARSRQEKQTLEMMIRPVVMGEHNG